MFSKLLGNPYALVAIAVASFSSGCWVTYKVSRATEVDGLREQLTDLQAAYAKRDTEYATQLGKDERLTADNATLRSKLDTVEKSLQTAMDLKPLTKIVTKVVHDENGDHACPVATRDDDYRLCINAAYSGDAAAIGACAAR